MTALWTAAEAAAATGGRATTDWQATGVSIDTRTLEAGELFVALKDVELEQPIFGANYIRGKVRAQPNGNFSGEAKFKLHFKHGGAIDFGQAMLKAAQMGEEAFIFVFFHTK